MPDLLWPDRAIGVFETLLVLDGSPIQLDSHLMRLTSSIRELFDADVPDEAAGLVLEHAAALALARLRLTVAPTPADGLAADAVTATVDPDNVFPDWARAARLRPLVIHGGLGAHKWADREGLAWTEASESDGSLPLILDVADEALEASRANIFIVESGALITPPLDGRILPGVARARAIETARSLGIAVHEHALTVERVIASGEAFLTGSVRGIEPVCAVGEVALRRPGETAMRLAAEMRRIWMGQAAARV